MVRSECYLLPDYDLVLELDSKNDTIEIFCTTNLFNKFLYILGPF